MPYSLRLIYFVSVVHTVITAHYLPEGRVGQQPNQTGAAAGSRVQRSPELLKMADAGEPSSLADAPVLCRAVRGDEGREITEMESCEPNIFCEVQFPAVSNIRKEVAKRYMNIYHEQQDV